MVKYTKFIFILLLTLFLTGCTSTIEKTLLENNVEVATKPEDIDKEKTDKEEETTDERIIMDAYNFLTLIKEKDIESLVQYWTKDYYNRSFHDINTLKESMVDAVQLYHRIIDFDTPLEVKVLNSGSNLVLYSLEIINIRNRDGHFIRYDGFYEDLVVSYYDGTPSFSSSIYNYYPIAYESMNAYIQAIKDADNEKLAWLLTPDVDYFPIELTEEIITNYKKIFDVPSLKAEVVSFIPEEQFIVNVSDKIGNSHTFNIEFGDGLWDINDNLIPREKMNNN